MVALVRFGHRHEANLSHTEARTERMPPFTSALRESEHVLRGFDLDDRRELRLRRGCCSADGRKEVLGPEPGGCCVFAKVVAKIGQREVDVTVTC